MYDDDEWWNGFILSFIIMFSLWLVLWFVFGLVSH